MASRIAPFLVFALAAVGGAIPTTAAAQGPRDALVQAPTFKQPERGSLAGGLAKFAIGAEDVSRGSFALALPIGVPGERGGALASVLPSYAAESGISEWGIGWSASLAIQRFRLVGDVDYAADDFSSPWGRLEQGSDGFYYPTGLTPAMRLERRADGWVATSPSGTRYEFSRQVATPEGVYAWYLTRVADLLGGEAVVEYAASPGGRPFVTRLLYGGREATDTYRLDLEYEPLPSPLLDYRSGYPLELDRRVVRVLVQVRQGGRGSYALRWTWDVAYRDAEFGPGFYLDSIARTFASGAVEPPISYQYDLPEQATPAGTVYRTGELEEAPGVLAYVDSVLDPDGIQPDRAAVTDTDEDGLPDLEYGVDFTLFRQNADGEFEPESLPPPPTGGDSQCRPADSIDNGPRTLVRMGGPGTDLQVLVLEAQSATTDVRVCDRAGTPRSSTVVEGRWSIEANTKVVDLDRDEKPDLLLVASGQYQVLENISGDGCESGAAAECVELGFRAHAPGELDFVNGFPFEPSATWAQDMNGDGIADLLLRSDDRVSIWYGRGRLGFDPTEHQLAFLNRSGSELFNLDEWEISWLDANRDGLTDALLVMGHEQLLFIDMGDHFQEVGAPALESVADLELGAPLVGDLRGRGDVDLTFVGMDAAYAIALADPSTGLMTSADDGKGTRVSFDYERAAARPGIRQRPPVLSSLTVATEGRDPVAYQYAYDGPQMHGVGHFLLGFATVEVAGPHARSVVDFHHDDDVAGQVDTTRAFDDRTPGLMKLSHTDYEEAAVADVRTRRRRTSWSGWCGGTDVAACIAAPAAAVERTEYLAYERGICPTLVRETDRHGQLETRTALAAPADLAGALHCVPAGVVWTGTHPDPSRDFRLENRLTVDSRGQPTRIEQVSGDESLTLQEVAYDPTTHRLLSIATPGNGAQTFAYDPDTGQLSRATGPDGVVSTADRRDPVTDALLELVGDRGPGGALASSYRYDEMERLAAHWADFGGSSEAEPLQTLGYRFPAGDAPGLIRIQTLVDASAHIRQESAAWTYPDGGELTSATRIPGRWIFGSVSATDRADLRTRELRRAPLVGGDPATATYSSLLSGTTLLGETVAAGFGHPISARDLIQQGIERQVATSIALEGGLVVTTRVENGAHRTRTAADVGGRAIWAEDQLGAVSRFEYDALGRLVGVVLPDGASHWLSFDRFGRPAQVTRDGIGTVSYAYEPVTGRLSHKEYRGADEALERTIDLEYDAIGRLTAGVHTQPATGDEDRFEFRYDGDVGDGEHLAGQTGYTSQVEGPAYTLTTVHNPDGTQASSRLVVAGWMQVDLATTYYSSGAVREAHRTITRLSDGAVIDDVATGSLYDAWGRLDRITVNGLVVATLEYDDDGGLAGAEMAGGQRIDQLYDPATHRLVGYQQEIRHGANSWHAGMEWGYDQRGLVGHETISVADQSWLRTYDHDARGFLTGADDDGQHSSYSYTAAGLLDRITDSNGARNVFRGDATTLSAGGITYTYDSSGRVVARGGAAFTYGPDGQLSTAQVGDRTLTYAYDADGNRLVKYENGAPVAAYLGGYLTEDSFVEPVEIGGRTVGVLEGGELHLLAMDVRGTLLADEDGTPRLATPYGVREPRPDLSAALDYVEKAYDADLGSVRMGVRDYDPLLGQFTTPDPLYLEAIDRCAASPVDCNLYSYARNSPVTFVDPTGTDSLIHGKTDPTDAGNVELFAAFRAAYPQYENIGGGASGPRSDGIMTDSGVRIPVEAGGLLVRRAHYWTKSGAFAAYQGYIHYAELLEAGHVSTALALANARGTPFVPDREINLDRYAGWATRVLMARNGVILGMTLAASALAGAAGPAGAARESEAAKDVVVPSSRYPETASHIRDAQAAGHPSVLTIERAGADANRAAAQAGHTRIPGKQLDEYPPAMFREGGAGASIRPISPRDNMGAGACIGNQCRALPNGSKVRIVVE